MSIFRFRNFVLALAFLIAGIGNANAVIISSGQYISLDYDLGPTIGVNDHFVELTLTGTGTLFSGPSYDLGLRMISSNATVLSDFSLGVVGSGNPAPPGSPLSWVVLLLAPTDLTGTIELGILAGNAQLEITGASLTVQDFNATALITDVALDVPSTASDISSVPVPGGLLLVLPPMLMLMRRDGAAGDVGPIRRMSRRMSRQTPT